MDFDTAIRAHSDWKMKLSAYLRSPNGALKVADVQVDNMCALGKWIYGDGAKFKDMSEYQKLKTEHARFHQAAADVVRKADAGQNTNEDTAIGGQSEFARASVQVVTAILAMKTKASAAA
jgi:hypothetical protein